MAAPQAHAGAALDRVRPAGVGLADFESAAELYRLCRSRGATVRKLMDCLIAAVAIREKVTVLHNDRDYEVLARHTRLRTERYRALRIVPSH